MGAVIIALTRDSKLLHLAYVVAETGETIALANVTSCRLVGFYCFKACSQAAVVRLTQQVIESGVTYPRDHAHEAGTCLVEFVGSADHDAFKIIANEQYPIPSTGISGLRLLFAERGLHTNPTTVSDQQRDDDDYIN